MLPASHRISGVVIGSPDVCLTPIAMVPVPIPYVNVAMNAAASVFSPTVIICGGNAMTVTSMIAVSSGDEPGTLHWTTKGFAQFTTGFPKVLINGLPGAMLTAMTLSNSGNCAGLQSVPSSTNVLYARAEGAPPGEPVVTAELLADAVGRVRIALFSGDAPARVHAAIAELVGAGATALVLDLRGNPGGEVPAAIAVAAQFLERGEVVATLVDADGDELVVRAASDSPCRLPLGVLVDGGTASAAELVAGALEAHGRAVALGGPTFGKTTTALHAPVAEAAGSFRVPEEREGTCR